MTKKIKNNLYIQKVKEVVKVNKPKYPFGLLALVKEILIELKAGVIPSIVLSNAIIVSKNTTWPDKLNLKDNNFFQKINDTDKRNILFTLEEFKKPNLDKDAYLIEFFSKNWINKLKTNPVLQNKEQIKEKSKSVNNTKNVNNSTTSLKTKEKSKLNNRKMTLTKVEPVAPTVTIKKIRILT